MTDHVQSSRLALSANELEGQFHRQIAFLERSAASFDAGFHDEAVRLATTLRVLVHSKKRSISLLEQLGRNYEFVDTSIEFDPDNLMPHSGLVSLAFLHGQATYAALLDEVPKARKSPFEEWWTDKVFVDSRQRVLTRKDLVLTAANQDGGAHVDRKLNEIYSDLHSRNSLGWKSASGQREIPLGSPVYPAIRQISHEVLKTIVDGYVCKPSQKYETFVVGASLTKLADPPSV